MSREVEVPEESIEDLYEDAPCGYLSTAPDGTILKVNRTFETWTGHSREDLLGTKRFQELLAPGGRIYHETHYAPLLRMQGAVREIALEIVRADGSRLPVLVNSIRVDRGEDKAPIIRTTIFDATDRRRYEQELLYARRREREIAEELQRSLLSGTFPSAPGLDVGVTYRAAVAGTQVGGDWYDAFWLDEDRIGLVVGDVVGRGIHAAATMGQLRSAVRALSSTGLGPGELLEALDSYADRHQVGRMTTVVFAELNVREPGLRFACAGHPPPVILEGSEPPRLAWAGRSTPLDVHVDDHSVREEAVCKLEAGGTILLYTDGLIERRDRQIDEGLDELLAQVQLHRQEPASELTANVARAMDSPDDRDDLCLLAASISPR